MTARNERRLAEPGAARQAPGLVTSPIPDPVTLASRCAQLATRLRRAGLTVEQDHPLGALTTLGVGGPAALFVQPVDVAALQSVLAAVLAEPGPAAVPMLVLGRGSNLLVPDAGFPGIAIRLGAGFKWLSRDGEQVSAGAGEAMPAVAAWAAREGLAGLEFGAGIPASVGGCVRMNAGAHGGDTAGRLVQVELTDAHGSRWVAPDQLGFGYRCSRLPPGTVVTAARWRLAPAEPREIRAELDRLRAWRRATQPLRQRNCGSVFTNPPGDSAARLIEAAGLKGRRIGGAAVSEKHANFIVVTPGARAEHVTALIDLVRRQVQQAGGPSLLPEVRVAGG